MTRRNSILLAVMALAISLGGSVPGQAQSKYSTWGNPDAQRQSESKVQEVVDDLKKLVRQARRDRAADPQFLDDLRNLVRRYEYPWRVSMLREDFSDGNFNVNPVWRITEGRFWVEQGFGLRAAFNRRQRQERRRDDGDAAAQLFGAILNRALGGSGRTTAQPREDEPRASIYVDGRITNAFAIQVELTSWRKQGTLEIGPYQGQDRRGGYRLFYKSGGGSPSLELARVGRRGTSVIETYNQSLVLEDNNTHTILWTRDRQGEMTVSIDGKELIKSADRRYREAFSGFSLTNHGGDYIISRVTIDGTR